MNYCKIVGRQAGKLAVSNFQSLTWPDLKSKTESTVPEGNYLSSRSVVLKLFLVATHSQRILNLATHWCKCKIFCETDLKSAENIF